MKKLEITTTPWKSMEYGAVAQLEANVLGMRFFQSTTVDDSLSDDMKDSALEHAKRTMASHIRALRNELNSMDLDV